MWCRICCGVDSAACPVSATGAILPPQSCSPACAVAIHSFQSTCGATFDVNQGQDDFGLGVHEFEQSCLSTADPMVFLEAIMVRAR
eukprot:COSAG06_NODE_1067_length_10841_cov_235.349283_7_plen_85_part_01